MGLKRFIQKRLLASAKPFAQKRKWRLGTNPPQLVGMILYMEDTSELVSLKRIRSHFFEQGIACSTCIYKKNKKMTIPEELIEEDMVILDQDSVNWYGMARQGRAESFIWESFDLLIDMSKEFFFTTAYIASRTRATLKIGRGAWPRHPFRIVLGAKPTDSGDEVVNLLFSCLQFITFK
jgi:hypothetical protein